ncbi:MAG: restriction endonuclease subunit S [Limisphaerales bacterium]
MSLDAVATIERDAIQPEAIGQGTAYLGLEHIESGGKILGAKPVDEGELASSKFKFTDRHVLYGKLRPYLAKIACPDFTGICSTDILPILPGPNLERRFLCYFLRQPSMVDYANSRAAGANLPRLSPSALAEFEIPLPPLAEQRRIAEVLDRAEALRAKRRAALAQLDSLTQSLFLDLFGDPATNPKGFPKKPLASLVRDDDTINYGVVQPGDDLDEGVPLVRVGDLIDGEVRHSELKRIAPSIEAAHKRSRLRGDEILVSCVGSIGVVALANESVKGFNIARAVARIRLAEATSSIFMAAYLSTDFVQRYFTNELRTVSQPTLNIKQLSETTVVLPPIELQREFARRVTAVEKLKTAQRASLAELDTLFTALQHRAFRGEL